MCQTCLGAVTSTERGRENMQQSYIGNFPCGDMEKTSCENVRDHNLSSDSKK